MSAKDTRLNALFFEMEESLEQVPSFKDTTTRRDVRILMARHGIENEALLQDIEAYVQDRILVGRASWADQSTSEKQDILEDLSQSKSWMRGSGGRDGLDDAHRLLLDCLEYLIKAAP